MKMYSGPLSLFTAKVRIALREKALDCDLWSVNFCRATGYEPKPADVVRLHPQGLVPILVDDDLTIYDSTQIFEYLEDRYPQPPLYPTGAKERVRCRAMEAYGDDVLFPHVWPLIEEVFYQTDPARADAEKIAVAGRELDQCYARLENDLDGRSFLCGDFSVADISVFMGTHFATNLGHPITENTPGLLAWRERVLTRPSVAAEVDQSTADLAVVLAGETIPEGPRSL